MEYEEQIKALSKSIYNKIIKIVAENQEEDYKYYEYAYIKLENRMQIAYNFEKGIAYFTKEDEKEPVFSSIIEINDDDTKFHIYIDDTYISYETNLEDKYNNCQKEKRKRSYYKEIKEQQELSEEYKKIIKEYYENLDKDIEEAIYNEDKTRDQGNFKDDVDDIYRNYMWEKEIEKLKDSKDGILLSVKVAVDWWANIISKENRSGNLGNDFESKLMMSVLDRTYPITEITKEQIKIFKESLTKKLMQEIFEYEDDIFQMKCDYGPDRLLYEAMRDAKIDTRRAPYKTELCISPYLVYAVGYYGEPNEILFDSTEDEDIEEVKRRYDKVLEESKTLKKEREII